MSSANVIMIDQDKSLSAQQGVICTLTIVHVMLYSMDESLHVQGSSSLTAKDLADLEATFTDKIRRKTGQPFFSEGEQTDFALLIQQGHVKVTAGQPPRTIAIRRPGEFVGEMAAMRKRPRSASVIAVCPPSKEVVALFLPGAMWHQFLRDHRDAMEALLIASEERLEQATRKIVESDLAVEQRVAKAFIELGEEGLGEPSGEIIVLRLSQQDLASHIGGSKLDSVKKVIRTFKDAGLISTGRQVTSILNPTAIRDIANGEVTVSAWSERRAHHAPPPA
jgi:CRP/FNR family transcriptional regulator, cyclic AMP receptor protein